MISVHELERDGRQKQYPRLKSSSVGVLIIS